MDPRFAHWLAVLGLAPGATADEIKEAHRDLTKVWHPDRFAHDPRLCAKAEEQLKQINGAYEGLQASSQRSRTSQPRQEGTEPSRQTNSTLVALRQRPGSSSQVRNRHVRLPLPNVDVRFNGQLGRLTNLSVTGGQLLLEFAAEMDSDATVLLQARREVLELRARVVRVTPAAPGQQVGSGIRRWSVSVAFVELPSDVQLAIPRFYNLLLGATGSRTA